MSLEILLLGEGLRWVVIFLYFDTVNTLPRNLIFNDPETESFWPLSNTSQLETIRKYSPFSNYDAIRTMINHGPVRS